MFKFDYVSICSAGAQRSPTGARIFKKLGYETKKIGIDGFTDHYLTFNEIPDKFLTKARNYVEWADKIFCMEAHHRDQMKFLKLDISKVTILRIKDQYDFMDLELIEILKKKVIPYLEE